jgi:hypothetical protein
VGILNGYFVIGVALVAGNAEHFVDDVITTDANYELTSSGYHWQAPKHIKTT